MAPQLNVIQHNVQYYSANKKQLQDLWSENHPDIILLNSTGLAQNEEIDINNYETYQSPQLPHSGSAILVKSSLRHKALTNTGHDQLLAVNVFTSEGIVTLATFYRVFDTKKEHSTIPYHSFNKLFQRKNPVFFLGDLNLNLSEQGYKTENNEAKRFKQLCLSTNSNINLIGPTFNTYYSHGGKLKGRPDIILSNKAGNEMNQYIVQGPMCGSDHTCIMFSISSSPIVLQTEERYVYNKANWKKFKETLINYVCPNLELITQQELDDAIENCFNYLQWAADMNIPKSRSKSITNVPPKSQNTRKLEICLSNIEYELINKQHTSDEYLLTLKSTKRELNQRVKESRDQDYTDYYQNLAKDLDTAFGKPEFWEKVDKLKGNTSHKYTTIEIDKKKVSEPQAVVEGFRKVWKPVFFPNPLPEDLTKEEAAEMKKVDRWCMSDEGVKTRAPLPHTNTSRLHVLSREQMKRDPAQHQLEAEMDLDDIKFFIRRLKNKKAPGKSGISNRIIKKIPDAFLQHIVDIFNAALSMGYFPSKFKQAITIMIPKKQKSKLNPINYRPISLLEPIGKLFESILNRRLKNFLEDKAKLHECQFGFRSGRSTQTSLHVMLNFITNARKRGLSVYMLSKDVEKAFDKVYFPSLVYKIHHNFDLPPLICKTLTSFLQFRTITIKVNGHTAEPFTPMAGVPQGSVLGPLLYLMYINDALLSDNENALNMYFADDNIILTAAKPCNNEAGPPTFRKTIQEVTNFERINRIKVNPSKSVAMVFDDGRTQPGWLKTSLNPESKVQNKDEIPHQQTHTILGITFDTKLNFKHHVKTLKGSINSTIRRIQPYCHAGIKPKTYLYTSLLQSKIFYSNVIYPYLDKSTIIELQKCQNNGIYKFIYSHLDCDERPNAMSAHVQLRMKSISQICYEAQRKFYRKLRLNQPGWFNQIKTWSKARIYDAGGADPRASAFEFACGGRPTFVYSKKYCI